MKEFIVISEKPSSVWISSSVIDEYERINSDSYTVDYLNKYSMLKESSIVFKELGDITSYISHITGFETEKYIKYTRFGKSFIRIVNLDNFFLNLDDVKNIPNDVYEILEKYHLQTNDILLSKDGTIGVASIITEDVKEAIASSHVVTIRPDRVIIDPFFLVTFINSKYGEFQCLNFSTGSIQKALNVEKIRRLSIPIPSSQIQKYIGDKIRKADELKKGAERLKSEAENILAYELKYNELDKEIEMNKSKSTWIKDFNLSDRADAEFYKQEFLLNQKHLEKLKSNGIQIMKLEEIKLDGNYGTLPSSNDYDKGQIILLRSTNISNFLIDYNDAIYVPEKYYADKAKISDGDILLEIKGAVSAGTVVSNLKSKTIINGSIFKFAVKHEYNNYYILAYLLSKSGQLQKKQNVANSIISYLSIDCINNLLVPILDSEKQNLIGEKLTKYQNYTNKSKQLIQEAKQDVEDLIEGTFDMSKLIQQ